MFTDYKQHKIFTVVKIHVKFFRFVMPCNFGGPCCLRLRGEDPEDGGDMDV